MDRLPLVLAPTRDQPTTQACPGQELNDNLFLCRTMHNQRSNTGQGSFDILIQIASPFPRGHHWCLCLELFLCSYLYLYRLHGRVCVYVFCEMGHTAHIILQLGFSFECLEEQSLVLAFNYCVIFTECTFSHLVVMEKEFSFYPFTCFGWSNNQINTRHINRRTNLISYIWELLKNNGDPQVAMWLICHLGAKEKG